MAIRKTSSVRTKTVYVEMTPAEHGVLKVEAAIRGMTMCDIVRNELIAPLTRKHRTLLDKGGDRE
jgi:hypothetical protein